MRMLWKLMVLYEIYREDGGNGITFVHMLYVKYVIIFIYKPDYKICICCFSTKHTALRSNVSKLGDIYTTDCCFLWASTIKIQLSVSVHRRMGHGFRFLLPLFSTTPLFSKFSYKSFLFQNFHNHSFFLHLTISVDVIHHE
jgi:hypothetical protein